ncbi:MAG: penicillin-binding protein 1A [Nevskiales bacterium]|nr:penicillin-binding protein 1A [Nevskiales bacterium]
MLAWLASLLLLLGTITLLGAFVAIKNLSRDLPSVDAIQELTLSEPLRIYTRDGQLIGEFGAERRATLRYSELPPLLVQAFLAAEDDRFFEHPGVDWQGLVRAAVKLALTGEKSQGGSTITMQLARNVFLSNERTFTRKFREILLALQMEDRLSKEQILEIYLNKIFLGERAYGVGAAALVYFGKPAGELTLGEMAVIAGLPKAPSRDNPVANPQRAVERRNYVLRRMHELGDISDLQYEQALAEPLVLRPYQVHVDVDAQYVAEMVRAELYAEYGEDAYTRGFTVTTTLDAGKQNAATAAVRQALLEYDQRHGWRGPEEQVPAGQWSVEDAASLQAVFGRHRPVAGLEAGIVTAASAERIELLTEQGPAQIAPEGFEWARLKGDKALQAGDVVRVQRDGDALRLVQVPEAQGAFVALSPDDGAIEALVGGLDFYEGKFNRATQARRQAGSGFKPFLYSAAMAKGFTPASVILDAPVVFDDPALESTWRPENYGGDIKGPMRLREALVQSRNLVSIRLLQAIGIDYARDFIPRFGLPADRLPHDLTMALGSAVFTPLEMARAYATIANGGFVIDPYFISEIRDNRGEVVFRAVPRRACEACEAAAGDAADPNVAVETGTAVAAPDVAAAAGPDADAPQWTPAPRAIDPDIIWLITDILRDVASRGTAARVRQLGRSDLAGKTGTTNDETDAWFNGFQRHQVAVAWVGFDQPTPLGRGEVGGRAALPAWMDFMKVALDGVPEEIAPRPPGLVNVRINPETGRLAAVGDPDAIFETVQADHVPEPEPEQEQQRESGADLQDLF